MSRPAAGRRAATRAAKRARITAAATIATTGIVLVLVFEQSLRGLEVKLAALINQLLTGGTVTTGFANGEPSFIFGSARTGYLVNVTLECSVALYLAVVIAMGSSMLLFPRLRLTRVLLAMTAAAAGVILLNQLRLLLLELALLHGGRAVFEWMHSLVGSTLMLVGLGVCLLIFFRMAVAGSPFRSAHTTGRSS